MSKVFTHKVALVLALMILTVPVSRLQAQTSGMTTNIVTGGDPQPTGEPPPPPKKPSVAVPSAVLAAMIVFGLA